MTGAYTSRGLDIYKLVIGWLLALSLAACQAGQPTVTPDSSTRLESTAQGAVAATRIPSSPTVLAAHTPTRALTTPTPSATALPCWQAGGRVEQAELQTDLLPQPLQFRVYLPPCYDELSAQHYPVLYLIHGQSFNDDQWQRLGAPEVVDRLSASSELAPFLIVMPRDRLWLEPAQDPFGQALVEALVPHIDASYRTLTARSSRAIGGLSRGGAWALHLGLTNWEAFGAIGLHSGFAFQSDVPFIKRWLDEIPLEHMPRFYLDVSDNDRPEIAQSAAWFERLLTERGIGHEWYLYPGFHEESYWQAHVEQYLRWYASEWK